MFDRLEEPARRTLVLAQAEAARLGHDFIGTEHILLGLIREGEGVAAQVLASLGVSIEAITDTVADSIVPLPASTNPATPLLTPRAKQVLEFALRESLQLGHNYIDTEHLLLGLTREGDSVAAQVLAHLGADLNDVRRRVFELLSGYADGKPGPVAPDRVMPRLTTVDPAELLGILDIEMLLSSGWRQGRSQPWIAGVQLRTTSFVPITQPTVNLAVVDGVVTKPDFDEQTAVLRAHTASWAEIIDGVGDAASWDQHRSALRAVVEPTAFVITVLNHPDPRAAAIQLARLVATRLDPRFGSGGDVVREL